MSKSVGLSRVNKKYLEIIPFPKETPCAGMLWFQAKSFYRIFKNEFKDGFKIVFGHKIPNMDNLGACLSIYHFAVELMLKGLIHLKNANYTSRSHNLINLLREAQIFHPNLSHIANNSNHMLLLQELGASFDIIRYAEGTICLSHNKKGGWENKTPNQELSEILDEIFNILDHSFREATKQPQ